DGYQPLMPTFQGLVSEENVMALVEYVKSLRVQTGAVSRGQAPEEPASRRAPQENREDHGYDDDGDEGGAGDVSQPRAHRGLLAADQGSQAYRNHVPHGRDLCVLPGRSLCHVDSSRTGHSG